ncbi:MULTISPECIES: dTDP-4-dehydrorhamnose reductase [unclassified Synechococcus]|uniref:dTDP-4-dehydrorhamnose reductase n=1 Tax=unclassified Synechococcus TaxID=2626047 RepID=UPI0000698F7A|nr:MULTISPECIES: dTDP-4-dehydrorhamnose reductase [unclassified Synechococcus]EAQ74091.1 dTDP-4-dehydrorhamnose reductase [Synechococcus sp. WH 5701]WFN58362.1 dTDP-4-dehydrorhamnose reductase [Synechococcus sp. CCFWC 502]
MSSLSPVLVIGRSGQVASALRRLAPTLLTQRPLLLAARPELDLAAPAPELDATVEQLLEQHQPALVLNAAAYTAVDKAESEPELAAAINNAAVGVLARACAARSLPLFHLSTDYVFAGGGERPWREDDPTGPLGVYGASKLGGEGALRAAGGPHLLLRVSWVFGVEGANFVRTMLRLGAERPALSVVADQIGGPTSAEAIATTWLSLAEAAIANRSQLDPDLPFPWGTYHYAGEPAVSWYGFAEAIFAEAVALGLLARAPDLTPIPTSAYPTPAQRPANSRMETSRFRAAFDIPPPDWREDLRTCLRAWA